MTISIDRRLDMRRLALSDVQAEYADLWDAWKVVETKAQPIVALAGVFLAGVFAYLTQLPGNATRGEHIWVMVVAIALVGSALFALSAIWVKDVGSPFLMSTENINEPHDVLKVSSNDAEVDERHEALLHAAATRWSIACRNVRRGLKVKQCRLQISLWLLCAAGLASLILVSLALFAREAATKAC